VVWTGRTCEYRQAVQQLTSIAIQVTPAGHIAGLQVGRVFSGIFGEVVNLQRALVLSLKFLNQKILQNINFVSLVYG
jgi:hypothetical protein